MKKIVFSKKYCNFLNNQTLLVIMWEKIIIFKRGYKLYLLKYFSYGLDVITGQYMSGDKVYIKIYNNSASTVYEAIGINPEIVTLVPGNVMMITGVRYFDTNIAIFFEVFQ